MSAGALRPGKSSIVGSLVGIGAEGQPQEVRIAGIACVVGWCCTEVPVGRSSRHPQESHTKGSYISMAATRPCAPSHFVLPRCVENQKQSSVGEEEFGRRWENGGRTECSHFIVPLLLSIESWVCPDMRVRAGARIGVRD